MIEEILAAEKQATEIRRGCDKNSTEKIRLAHESGDALYEQTLERAEKARAEAISEAKKQAEAMIDENRRAAYENAATAVKIAEKNIEAATDFIINSILKSN